MATSIQRLMIVIIMMDILFVIVGGFVYNHSDPKLEAIQYTDGYADWNKEFREIYPESNPDTSSVYLSQQVMDDKYGGQQVFKILSGGVEAPEIEVSEADSGGTAGSWIYWAVGFVLLIINALGAFEIFQIFYSKKNT